MKHISIDKLNEHLFETIEMLKNSQDKNADDCEKIDVGTAQSIAKIGKVVIDGYKIKAQVLKMIKPEDNPTIAEKFLQSSGLIQIEQTKSLNNTNK